MTRAGSQRHRKKTTYRATLYSLQPTFYQKFIVIASVVGLSDNWLDVRWVPAVVLFYERKLLI